jgi:hypothetical protein
MTEEQGGYLVPKSMAILLRTVLYPPQIRKKRNLLIKKGKKDDRRTG